MTNKSRLFRYLWRFNAVVLAGIGIAVACVVAFSVLDGWRSDQPAPAGHFAPVPQGAEKTFTYRLESNGVRQQVGQEELIALGRWAGSPESYGLSRGVSERVSPQSNRVNLLAVDQATAESHWLFKGYDRAIVADEVVYDTISQRPDHSSSSPVALAMLVIDSDTNKDGELTEKDRQSIYIYRPGEAGAVRLLTADLIVSHKQTSNDHYLVIYENGSAGVAASYSLPEFKLIAEKPLPKVPNG